MQKPEIPENEIQRLEALEEYAISQIIDKEDYDFLTKMAAQICGTKISLISIIHEDKQKFLSKFGLEAEETSRDVSFCAHAINTPNKLFEVKDASKDKRFNDNPQVKNKPGIKFYASKPLVTETGFPIGTLCVIDSEVKELSDEQKSLLDNLSRQVMKLLELRKNQLETLAINEKLKKNNAILELTQKASNIGAWELDINTGKTVWSERVYEIYEIDKDFEHNKDKGLEYYHPNDRKNILDAIESVVNDGKDFDIVNRLVTNKGNERWVRITGRKVDDKIIGSFQDVTKIKKDDLKYKAIFNSALTFLGFINLKGILYEVNESSLSLANLKKEDVIGKPVWECYWWQFSEETKLGFKQNVEKALKGEKVYYEALVLGADRKPIKVLISLKPIYNEKGNLDFVLAEGSNVEDVAKVRKRFKLATEGANVGTWEYNVQTGKTIYNEKWANILGYSLDELEPISIKTWEKLTHPEDLKNSNKAFRNYLKKKQSFYERENRMRHKDGHWVWVLDRGKIFKWTKDGKPLKMYGVHQDITSFKKNQEALRISEETFRGNFENAAIGMALIDTLGNLYKVNDKLCEMLGYTNEELLNKKLKEITHPKDFKNDTESLKKVISKEISNYKTQKRYLTKDNEVLQIIVAISVVRDTSGDVLYFVAQLVDITQIKKVESEMKTLLDIANSQNNKLMDFAHIVSHNLRSHSSGLIGLLDVVANEIPGISDNEYFNLTNQGANNLHNTIEELSKIISITLDKSELKFVKLRQSIETSINLLSDEISKTGIRIDNKVDKDLKIWGLSKYIENIAYNLISNAIKYKSDKRDSYLKIYSEISNDTVDLFFEDNGIGIDLERNEDRVFQMYKTFHTHGVSRGVGLYVTKKQVESMNGQIEVESKVDVGTTFKIKLPHEKN